MPAYYFELIHFNVIYVVNMTLPLLPLNELKVIVSTANFPQIFGLLNIDPQTKPRFLNLSRP